MSPGHLGSCTGLATWLRSVRRRAVPGVEPKLRTQAPRGCVLAGLLKSSACPLKGSSLGSCRQPLIIDALFDMTVPTTAGSATVQRKVGRASTGYPPTDEWRARNYRRTCYVPGLDLAIAGKVLQGERWPIDLPNSATKAEMEESAVAERRRATVDRDLRARWVLFIAKRSNLFPMRSEQ